MTFKQAPSSVSRKYCKMQCSVITIACAKTRCFELSREESDILATTSEGRSDRTEGWNSIGLPPFWQGFGLTCCPYVDGKSILEIGCGEGRRCFELVSCGAAHVVGLDPLSISAAGLRLQNSPLVRRNQLIFFKGELASLPPEKFDIIVSENTLEHVADVPGLLAEIRLRLNPGGRVYLGFGPLYHAPEGDHGWLRAVLPGRRFFWWPWGHLLFERYALSKLSALHGRSITRTDNWPYLHLNRHTAEAFERMFLGSGLRVVLLRRNYVKSLKGKIFAAAGQLPVLSQYFTLNLFVILDDAGISDERCSGGRNNHPLETRTAGGC